MLKFLGNVENLFRNGPKTLQIFPKATKQAQNLTNVSKATPKAAKVHQKSSKGAPKAPKRLPKASKRLQKNSKKFPKSTPTGTPKRVLNRTPNWRPSFSPNVSKPVLAWEREARFNFKKLQANVETRRGNKETLPSMCKAPPSPTSPPTQATAFANIAQHWLDK